MVGEQVRPERGLRPAALLQRREQLRERLGDQVLHVRRVAHQRAGHPPGGLDVPAVEQRVGRGVAAANGRDQLRVGRFRGVGGEVCHRPCHGFGGMHRSGENTGTNAAPCDAVTPPSGLS